MKCIKLNFAPKNMKFQLLSDKKIVNMPGQDSEFSTVFRH
jgi:hypothetical protein